MSHVIEIRDSGDEHELKKRQKQALFTPIAPTIAVIILTVFAFMAGAANNGPKVLLEMKSVTFSIDYVRLWGARYFPHDFDNGWRWLTCTLVHVSFTHMITNFIFMMILGITFESMAGSLRTLVVFVASALGGGFIAIVTESPCVVYIGASGINFGFAGALVAYSLRNAILKKPFQSWISWWGVVAGEMFMIIGMFLEPIILSKNDVSNMTHFGGFMSGLVVCALMLPPQGNMGWKSIQVASGLMLVAIFAIAPAIAYTSVLEDARVC